MVDVKFDESNGSQVEKLPIDVGDKDPPKAILDLSIGKIHPTEVKESTSSIQVEASTSHEGEPQVEMVASTSETHQNEGNEEVQQDDPPRPPPPPPQANNDANEGEDDEEDVPPQPKQNISRVRARVTKNHLAEQIYDDINSGRITRCKICLANFCEHYPFISSIEPMKVEEALEDPDWINAMYEELHNFERNQVWTLVEKTKDDQNIIETKWLFGNKQDEGGAQQDSSRCSRLHSSRRYALW
jgi:hypothetical protein